jgi:hypothetical protein
MFEIHLTVQTDNIEKFKSDCLLVGVKPLLIELQNQAGKKKLQTDVMTAKSFKEGDWVVELDKMVADFDKLGYEVIRRKVEVDPNHYGIESVTGDYYYESHVRVETTHKKLPVLAALSELNKFHLSRNKFKVINHKRWYQMATLRMYDRTLTEFKNTINDFLLDIGAHELKYDKIEVECAIYDSNVKHDNVWI